MSKKDSLKEKIALCRFLLGICFAVILSIGGWLATNISKINFLFVIGCVAEILLLISFGKLIVKIIKYIKELEDLE